MAKDSKAVFNVRIPPELHKRARLESVRTERPLTQVIEELVRRWLDGEIKIKGHEPPK